MTGAAGREVEIKLRLEEAAPGRRLLEAAGFHVVKPRVFEANELFDTAEGRLRAAGSLVRLRQAGQQAVLTFKGPATYERHKSREELEVELSDARAATGILARLGFEPVFRYQKYRTEYAAPGESGVAHLDETPVGDFLELEGPPEWIDRSARRLGFTEADYITASYATLYVDWCRARGLAPGHMEFGRGTPRPCHDRRTTP
jgi:adenylate cyclase class 2